MEESKNGSQMDGDKACKICKTCPCACGTCPMGKTCACGYGCGCGWAHGHHIFRVVLAIVIVLVVFWIGMKVGEVRTMLGEYGYGGGYGWHHAYPMQGYYQDGSVTPANGSPMMTGSSTSSGVPAQ